MSSRYECPSDSEDSHGALSPSASSAQTQVQDFPVPRGAEANGSPPSSPIACPPTPPSPPIACPPTPPTRSPLSSSDDTKTEHHMPALDLPPPVIQEQAVATRAIGTMTVSNDDLARNMNVLTNLMSTFVRESHAVVQESKGRFTAIESDVSLIKNELTELREAVRQSRVPAPRNTMPSFEEVKTVMVAAATDVKNADVLRLLCSRIEIQVLFTMLLAMDVSIPTSGWFAHHVTRINDVTSAVFYIPHLANLLFLFANLPLVEPSSLSSSSKREDKTLAIMNAKAWQMFVNNSDSGLRGILSPSEMVKKFLSKLRDAFSDADMRVDMGMGYGVKNNTLRALGVAHNKYQWFNVTAELTKGPRSSSNQAALNFVAVDARRLIEALLFFSRTETCHLHGSRSLLQSSQAKAHIQRNMALAVMGRHVQPPSDNSQTKPCNVYNKAKDILRRQPSMRILNLGEIKLPTEVEDDAVVGRKILNLIKAVPLVSSMYSASMDVKSETPKLSDELEACGKPGFSVSSSWAAKHGAVFADFYQSCIEAKIVPDAPHQVEMLRTGSSNLSVLLDMINAQRAEDRSERAVLTEDELQRRWTESREKQARKAREEVDRDEVAHPILDEDDEEELPDVEHSAPKTRRSASAAKLNKKRKNKSHPSTGRSKKPKSKPSPDVDEVLDVDHED